MPTAALSAIRQSRQNQRDQQADVFTGQAHLAVRMYEDVQASYDKQSPISDRARATCRIAYGMAQSGRYAAALRLLEELASSIQGVLKLEQRVTGFTMLVQLTRSLRR